MKKTDKYKGIKKTISSTLGLIAMRLMLSLLSVVTFSADLQWIKLLSIVMILCWFILEFGLVKSKAYSDFQLKKNNDIRRRRGDEVESSYLLEYSTAKAFIAGGMTVVVSVLLLILFNIFGATWMRASVVAINFVYIVPMSNFFGVNSPNYLLIGLFIQYAIFVLSYLFEGYRQKLIYENIMAKVK